MIEQAVGVLTASGREFEAFHFRTIDQHELDLVLDLGGERWAIEVKLTASPTPADMQRLVDTATMIRASRSFLVSRTKRTMGDAQRASCNLPWLIEELGG